MQLHSWLRTASLLLHWQKEKKPFDLDSSNHENKFETLRNNNDDNTLGPKLFALTGIENTFQYCMNKMSIKQREKWQH